MDLLATTREYYIINAIQGTFCQSYNIFGQSAGLQCCANSLMFLCWTKVKRISQLLPADLDTILRCGDHVYNNIVQQIGNFRLLGADDIPVNAQIFDETVNVTKHRIQDGEIRDGVFITPLTQLTSSSPYNITGYLLFINSMTLGLILDDISTQCFLFDSHSRNSNGLPVPAGNSILMTFYSLEVLENYIQSVHCSTTRFESVYFNLLEIEIQISASSKTNIRKNMLHQREKVRYQLNKEKIKEASQRAYQKSREKNIGKVKKRYQENPEPFIKRAKKAYERDPKAAMECAKRAYEKNSKSAIARAKQAYNKNPKAAIDRAKQAYSENPKPTIDRAKQAYKENPKPTIDRAKQSYANNPMPTMQRAQQTYIANAETINKKPRAAYSQNPAPAKERSSRQYENENIKDQYRLRYRNSKSVHNFIASIWDGPYYICVICNRTLYKTTVKHFDPENYPNLDIDIATDIESFDGNMYVCITCDSKLRKKSLPCQAVRNKLHVESLPEELSDLRSLEKLLVAKRILFKKVIVIHGKGEFPKVKGTICNVPIESEDIATTLPRHADSNGVMIVKLKRKLIFKGHYKCEPVRPFKVIDFLHFLKQNNSLYADVNLCPDNIVPELTSFANENDSCPDETDIDDSAYSETTPDIESTNFIENPQAEFQMNSNKSVLVSNISQVSEEENLVIAPGEGQSPLSMARDDHCEELSFPHLFPRGKYGRTCQRNVPISATKYFNQRLLNYTQRFASDTEYIFYARALLEKLNLISSMSIAMQIVRSRTLTAGHLQNNFDDYISNYISQNDAFKFMRSIRGSPAYWKQFLMEVLAMVKQLGLPSYFFTLSCADLRWNELIFIIVRLNGRNISREEIETLNYQQRATILNSNPVLLARHFQYRTQLFFKNVLLNGPLGIAQYYAYRVEFQQRGSPHIHGFLWIKDFPQLDSDSTEEYLNYLDNIVLTNLPDQSMEPELFEYVKTFQIHRHSTTCWKYKKNQCRFHFGKFFTEKSIIAKPLADALDIEERQEKLQWRQSILEKVKSYIDEHLNPAKTNIIDPSEENFVQPKSIDEILLELDIPKDDYYGALSISKDQDFEIHFQRSPNSCFVNNYFADGLIAWQANIDIQPIFNHYKAVTYMCSYFSKCEQECTMAMMQAVKESFEQDQPYYEQMKRVALAYSTKRECSVQEAVYHCLPELHLRRVFPGVTFANSNLPEHRFRMLKKKEDIDELPTESQDIFKRGDLERYMGRPNTTFKGGRFAILDGFCFVEFLAYYDLISKPDDNDDYQPNMFPDIEVETNHDSPSFPAKIPLMDSKENLRLRKVKKVVRYFVPRNKEQNPEKYAHHLLMLFYPFRKEDDLMTGYPPTYCGKLSNPAVIEIINTNKQKFEPFGDLVEEALLQFNINAQPSYDATGQIENDETTVEFPFPDEEYDDHETAAAAASSTIIHPLVLPDDEINRKINSLNTKQRIVFDYVLTWARRSVQYKGICNPVDPFHIFLSGSGGCGKSHLIKTIYHAVSKTFLLRSEDPLKCRVLLLAPTGVAAINIEGTTIHSGLGINPNRIMSKLSDSTNPI